MGTLAPWFKRGILFFVLLGWVAIFTSSIEAGVVRNFTVRFSANDTGDIVLVGNSLSTCNIAATNCATARAGTGPDLNNNSFDLAFIDIDSDPTTFNSSSANFSLPSGATVTWAGFYWAADVANSTPNTNQAKLRPPGAAGYTTINATQFDTTPSGVSGRSRYQAFANVTAQVQAAGTGTYTAANVQAISGTGNKDGYAAWTLVIVYQDINQPLRNLTVFDGYSFVTSTDPSVNVSVSGFLTPLSGAVNTKIGAVVYEGDLGLTGDSLKLNSTTLSNAVNPATNFFNSTISNLGIRGTTKNPDYVNLMAFDADLISANSILPNGATGATLNFSTSSDAYYPGVLTFVTDLHAPRLTINKSVQDINGGQVEPNDILLYTISLNNSGLDNATNVILLDPIPANSTYLSNSLVITAGANSGAKTDVSSDDQAEYEAGPNRVRFRLGTGATAASGGTLAVGATTTIQFRVRVNTPLPNATVINNQAVVNYNAAVSGLSFSTPSNPISVAVISAPQVTVRKQAAVQVDVRPTGPSPGDTLRYTINIQNTGNANATSVIFNDTPDSNTTLVVGSVTTSSGTVTSGNSPGQTSVSVNIGLVAAAGGSATITFDATVNNPVPAGVSQVSNQGLLTSAELPSIPTDDPATPPVGDPTVTFISAAPSLTSYKSATLANDADGNGIPSPGDTLLYAILVSNSGNQNASGVVFSDVPGANSTLVAGSVVAVPGVVTLGNTDGDTAVSVTIGTLAGGSSATVTFQVTINNPLPTGVKQVSNQGRVDSVQLPPVFTDDPNTLAVGDPTITPVTAAPVILATKRVFLVDDADGSGSPSPGDRLRYQVTVQNTGNTAATGLQFVDNPPTNTSLVIGSVQTSLGTVAGGNTAGDSSVTVNLVTLLSQSQAVIEFDVLIDNPLPLGVTKISNQGRLNSNELPVVVTDDPDTPAINDPTATAVTAAPILSASKISLLSTDNDADGVPSPGDLLLYTIIIQNNGNTAASGVLLNDLPGANTTLQAGSVQTSQGMVNQGNTTGDMAVEVAVGTIPGGSSAVVTFLVQVNNPLPPNVRQVINQGQVTSSELPAVLTDDPATPSPNDPTITPITAAPRLDSFKDAVLTVDADQNGQVSPGDTLLYHITLINNGNTSATMVVFSDQPDNNTTLVPFTVQSSQGTVLKGNNQIDTTVEVDLGEIPAGTVAGVTFEVQIKNPVSPGTLSVSNQGIFLSSELPILVTDDSATQAVDDPTITTIVAAPNLVARKSDFLLIDLDNNGVPSPDDTLLYTIRLVNIGNTTATGVVFNDTPDGNTSLAAGTVQTGQGTVTTGNTDGDTAVAIDVGPVAAGAVVLLSFQVTINNPLPGGVTFVANQGSITSNELPVLLTDDSDTPNPADPTLTPVSAAPLLSAAKTDFLVNDLNGDGQVSPGDTILYEILLYNGGQTAATNVVITDTPDPFTSLVVGSVMTNRGGVTTGNTAGDTSVIVTVGDFPANRMMRVTFVVMVDNTLPSGIEQVGNQAVVASNELPDLDTDDPDTPATGDVTVTIINAAPDLVFEKTDGGGTAALGGLLVYTLNYSNQGNQDATGVILEETVPTYTTFNSANSDPSWSCSGTTAGSTCTLSIGSLAVGSGGYVLFAVDIASSVPAGVNEIRNIGSIGDDGSNGQDLEFSNNVSSDDTGLTTPNAIQLREQRTQTASFPIGIAVSLIIVSMASIFVIKRKRSDL